MNWSCFPASAATSRLGRSVTLTAGGVLAMLVSALGVTEADGWRGVAARPQIQPVFEFKPAGGPAKRGSWVIRADKREGLDGHWAKAFPVQGGQWYGVRALRRVTGVPTPRRSTLVRVLWQDAQGGSVRHDEPGAKSYAPGEPPIAEPEYPADGATDARGWTEVTGVYRAPAKAQRAVVELHLRWAPRGRVEWSEVSLTETPPPPSRKVRLATVHYVPKGGKTAMDNCRQFEPFIQEAARQGADLLVLPETLTATGNGLSYTEAAEPIPGPATAYFAAQARQHRLHLVAGLGGASKPLDL